MTSLMIRDLEVRKDLTSKEAAAVRGGFDLFASQDTGQYVSQTGGLIFGSPVIVLAVPIQVQTGISLDLANIVGSIGAVSQ